MHNWTSTPESCGLSVDKIIPLIDFKPYSIIAALSYVDQVGFFLITHLNLLACECTNVDASVCIYVRLCMCVSTCVMCMRVEKQFNHFLIYGIKLNLLVNSGSKSNSKINILHQYFSNSITISSLKTYAVDWYVESCTKLPGFANSSHVSMISARH